MFPTHSYTNDYCADYILAGPLVERFGLMSPTIL